MGVDSLFEELEIKNPELDERCGLLNSQLEIYALRIPEGSEYVYVVSLDISQSEPWLCRLHRLLPQRGRPCESLDHNLLSIITISCQSFRHEAYTGDKHP